MRRRGGLQNNPLKKAIRSTEVEGDVTIAPVPVTFGEDITVQYQGLLARAGAEQVYLHMGYGPADRWQFISDIPMEKVGDTWEAKFEVTEDSRLNFCFRDNAGNWDNNSGRNWSVEVHTGKQY